MSAQVRTTSKDAIVLTIDNLGEASELERGTRDARVPIGAHPSVTDALPRLLDELDRLGLPATFFVEGINCELNPKAVRAIAARGHELGVHGWRHEDWAALDPARERQLLEQATTAFESLQIETVAFRPPGGGLTASTPQILRELGYQWCSPALEEVPDEGPEEDHGLRWVPFDWELVDAYHLMESFATLRVQRGDSERPLDPPAVADRLAHDLLAPAPPDDDHHHRDGTPRTVILHPFLMLDDAWWEGTRRTLALIAELGGG